MIGNDNIKDIWMKLDLQLIEDSILFVKDIPKLRGTITVLIKHIRDIEFTDAELKEIKEAVWESLDQFSMGIPATDLRPHNVNKIFTPEELKARQSVLRKLKHKLRRRKMLSMRWPKTHEQL
jgi:hypothetical protein